MDDVTRISEMEELLDECRQALEVLHGALDRVEELQDDMGQLFASFRMLELGTDLLKNRI